MPKNRRGLSSVVGALFFTILMVSGFSVLSLALDAQTDIVTTQRMISDIEIKKQQEQFGVLASVDENDLLSVSIQNQGQYPVEITSMWITNKTLSDQPAERYTVNYDDAFISSGFTNNVLSSQILQMIPDTYDIKIISAFGSIKTVELDTNSGISSIGLRSELITDPPDVIMGQNVTVAMLVTNTGYLTIEDVHPNMQPVDFSGIGTVVGSTPYTPSPVDLRRGESVMFTWDYQVDGDSGVSMIFTANAEGKFDGKDVSIADVSDTSILRDPSDGGESNFELIVLTQDLLAKPELFIVLPVPFGESASQGIWGVNIVNPIEKDLEVSKIVITVASTRYTGGDEIFTDNNDNACAAEHVDLLLGGTWSCPMANQLMWKNLDNPVTVSGLSNQPFLALVEPGFIGSSDTFLETVPVDIQVYTTLGQFGKAGYGTSYHEGGTTLPNVYLTDVPGSTANANILTSIAAIPDNSPIKLNATLTDFDSNTDNVIQGTDSRLIINIPKGWTNPSVISAPGFTVNNPNPLPFADGSYQIVGVLNSDITEPDDAQTIQFQVTPPDVSSTQLYVMYVLADGISNSGGTEAVAVGALAEVILQVIDSDP
jgi:hypothetical protein